MSGFSLHGMGLALSRGELKIPPLEETALLPSFWASGSTIALTRSGSTFGADGRTDLPGLLSDPAANAAERDPDENPELCLHTKTSCLARPGATSIASVRQAPAQQLEYALCYCDIPAKARLGDCWKTHVCHVAANFRKIARSQARADGVARSPSPRKPQCYGQAWQYREGRKLAQPGGRELFGHLSASLLSYSPLRSRMSFRSHSRCTPRALLTNIRTWHLIVRQEIRPTGFRACHPGSCALAPPASIGGWTLWSAAIPRATIAACREAAGTVVAEVT